MYRYRVLKRTSRHLESQTKSKSLTLKVFWHSAAALVFDVQWDMVWTPTGISRLWATTPGFVTHGHGLTVGSLYCDYIVLTWPGAKSHSSNGTLRVDSFDLSYFGVHRLWEQNLGSVGVSILLIVLLTACRSR